MPAVGSAITEMNGVTKPPPRRRRVFGQREETMKKHPLSPRTLVVPVLIAAGSLLVGCGSTGSSNDQPAPTAPASEGTTTISTGDPAVDAVDAELSSLDDDLQVIDEALAELDSLDTTAP